ncbi:MAG: multicopper oxidase domain-containing protein, partial [Chloroflexota bacterium]
MRTVLAATAALSLVAVAFGMLAAGQGRPAPSATSRPATAAASPTGTLPSAAASPAPAASAAAKPAAASPPVDVARRPDTVPAAITRSSAATVSVELETTEVVGRLADGKTYAYWTFGGTVPGPFLRVRVGDTIELHLKNAPNSAWPHSIDLHAVNGPGGGAGASQTAPGKDSTFRFKALNPGL